LRNAAQVRSILYTSVPELTMSDHKPIKSILEVCVLSRQPA
jgi:hypothetical protein